MPFHLCSNSDSLWSWKAICSWGWCLGSLVPVKVPCAFLSHWFTPAERNFEVEDWELLAVKLELEDWRCWLEEAQYQILVFTDHKNLEYIQQAQWLNPCQAQQSLFISCFNFNLSYFPGSKYLKPDSLSQVSSPAGHKQWTSLLIIIATTLSWWQSTGFPERPTHCYGNSHGSFPPGFLILHYLWGLTIVSDRGTQFTSHVWKALCSHLGINVSLRFSYHPQFNGQMEC